MKAYRIPQRASIPGFEGLYYVTPDAHVFNAITGKELKRQKSVEQGSGSSLKVHLRDKAGKRYCKTMGWVMRQAFFGGAEGVLMHKDGSSWNYTLGNLKLVSNSELSKRTAAYAGRPVVYRLPNGEETIYSSPKKAAEELFVHPGSIRNWCSGRTRNTLFEGEFFYEDERRHYKSRSRKDEGTLRVES